MDRARREGEEEEDEVGTMGADSTHDETRSQEDGSFGGDNLMSRGSEEEMDEEEAELDGSRGGEAMEEGTDEGSSIPSRPTAVRHRGDSKVVISEASDESSTDASMDPRVEAARRRQALLPLDTPLICEPGRLTFRTAVTVMPAANLSGANDRRGKKNTTPWVDDARGYKWRLMYFPYGNNLSVTAPVSLSVYLELDVNNPVRLSFSCMVRLSGEGEG